ncbi:small ribosomal subunit protein S13 [Cucumis melo var. makuwa]|uniref:Small ribosomal subunit protein S13 n=2 Tax=Cucumis melo TaxID=3656 RepID=A0A5D3DT03_CUCMM|nr:small ribosomal subunit protein S13 [Cucumis melo var. makuwa]TYK26495.1 small ribosomal subunit protein S13 [Cucumis melo var. makuwa]
MAGLTIVLEPLEVGLAIRGRRWSFDVSNNKLFLAAFNDVRRLATSKTKIPKSPVRGADKKKNLSMKTLKASLPPHLLFRRSLRIVSNALLPRFESLSIQSIHLGAGMKIPDSKPLKFALQCINGIGQARANQVLAQLPWKTSLPKILLKESSLFLQTRFPSTRLDMSWINVFKGTLLGCRKFSAIEGLLPCRGQRTKTNARTMKSKQTHVGKRKTFC